ncbi:MAG: potassium channel family protein [Thermoplasmata archaeon]
MARPRWRYALNLFRRIYRFLLFYGFVYGLAGVGFYYLEGGQVSLFNAFYWSIVTLGTVGYGDIVPTTFGAKILASLVIATQLFLLGYLLTAITSAVTEESQHRLMGTYGTSMEGHVVVLGYSGVGRAAVRELLVQRQKVAVVTEHSDDVSNIRSLASESDVFVTFGVPSELDILARLNLPKARSAIVCTSDDATNMIGALNVRSLAPQLRVVVSVSRPELRDTLRTAGVTYVASPSDMGGRLCASAAFEPEVANAIEDLTAADVHSDMAEYILRTGRPLDGTSFGEAEGIVRAETGCILIGHAVPRSNGEFELHVAPPPATRLAAGHAVVLVGTIPNVRRFRTWFGSEQGR